MTPPVEPTVLAGSGFRVQALDPPHDQTPVDLLVLRTGHERGVGGLGDLRVGDQFTGIGVHERVRILTHLVSGIVVIAVLMLSLDPVVNDTLEW